jgi:hypothetical protein
METVLGTLLSKQPLPFDEEGGWQMPLSVQARGVHMMLHVKRCKALVTGVEWLMVSECMLDSKTFQGCRNGTCQLWCWSGDMLLACY